MYLGIDIGTSAVKVVLTDDEQHIVDQASAPLTVARPQPSWSEQNPEDWWDGTRAAMAQLRQRRANELGMVRSVGLSGQMHAATLLDAGGRPLRPAILWNDGRSSAECAELERREPRTRQITGNLAMPGFTAPKLLWVARHEPEVFAQVAKVLLPKDYVRFRMTGAYASDMSDSAGTLWLDVGRRQWSTAMIEATDLRPTAMPELFEGSEPTAPLHRDVAAEWGVPAEIPVAAGAGDNAAGAVGSGVVVPGAAFLSLSMGFTGLPRGLADFIASLELGERDRRVDVVEGGNGSCFLNPLSDRHALRHKRADDNDVRLLDLQLKAVLHLLQALIQQRSAVRRLG